MDTDYYTTGEKEFLLKIANKTLEHFLISGEKFEPQTINKKLWEKKGIFVTLTLNDELRGCMGNVEPIESLIISIRNNAILAANDSRFEPLKLNELKDIEIEISILSVLTKSSLDSIKKGDGVLIKKDNNMATYLPTVWQSFKSKDEFIASLYEKAGIKKTLGADTKTEFFTYNAIVFK